MIADPKEEYVIDTSKFYSKGKNTPFHGHRVFGRVLFTLVDGKIVYEAQKAERKKEYD